MEEGACLDPAVLQPAHHLIARHAEPIAEEDSEHPEDVLRPGPLRGERQVRLALQEIQIDPGDLSLPPNFLLDPLALRQADRGLEIGHAVVEPEVVVDEARLAEGLIAQKPCAAREVVVARDDHPALARREDLVAIEAEGTDRAQRAHPAPVHLRAVRFGAVLDHEKLVASRDVVDRVHVAGVAVHVHGQDAAGARRDLRLDPRGIEAPDLGIDIHGNGPRAREDDHVRASDEREVGKDHLVSRTDPCGGDREMDRRRAAAARDPVANPAASGEGFLESGDVVAHRGDPRGVEAVDDVLLLAPVQNGFPDRNHHLTSSPDRGANFCC